jgi:hypothetical protein
VHGMWSFENLVKERTWEIGFGQAPDFRRCPAPRNSL